MAKTRMKTTPTRMQKDALIASAATTVTITKPSTITAGTCHNALPLDEVKKRLRQATILNKPIQQTGTSTIIVTAPKRTNSISSVASSISHTSDAHSDTESPPPQPILAGTSTATTIATTKTTKPLPSANTSSQTQRTLNNLLSKPTNEITALRNRKVFMITEKTDEVAGTEASTSTAAGAAPGQKRKMYLIMEENSSAEDETLAEDGLTAKDANKKYLKREKGLMPGAGGSKKLTLFADKTVSGALTEKFEKILPEILNRIKGKDTNGGVVLASATSMTTPKLEAIPKMEATPKMEMATKREATSKLEPQAKFTSTRKLEPLSKATLSTTSAPIPGAMTSSKLLNGGINLNIVKSEPIKAQQQHQHEQYKQNTTEVTTERLPITLPPKKNRTKIITTTTAMNNAFHNAINNNNNNTNIVTVDTFNDNASNTLGPHNKIGAPCQIKQISAATPVIVSTATVARNNIQSSYTTTSSNEPRRFAAISNNAGNNNSNNTNIKYATNGNKGAAVTTMAKVEAVPRNINLSGDFHFLMEMLPKLESIPEPHKTNVKNCIERIITQNANIFVKK